MNDQLSSPIVMDVRNWDTYWQRIKSCALLCPASCILYMMMGAGQREKVLNNMETKSLGLCTCSVCIKLEDSYSSVLNCNEGSLCQLLKRGGINVWRVLFRCGGGGMFILACTI